MGCRFKPAGLPHYAPIVIGAVEVPATRKSCQKALQRCWLACRKPFLAFEFELIEAVLNMGINDEGNRTPLFPKSQETTIGLKIWRFMIVFPKNPKLRRFKRTQNWHGIVI